MPLRLNKLENKEKKGKYGQYGDPTFPLCTLETDTTEHIIKCEKHNKLNLDGQSHKDL